MNTTTVTKVGVAVVYVRISSEEQLKKSATSIGTQTKKCSEVCNRAGLNVAKVFTDEGESAFKQAYTERPQLQKLLSYLREHKEVTHVVFENLSRLARQGPEQAMLLAQFKKAGLDYISVDEPNAESKTAAGRMAVNMIGVFNEYSSDSLSERVTYRMQAGAKAGRHLQRAMLGYLNGKMPNGVKNIIPDPERADLVRKAFTLVAEGNRLVDALRIVTALGLRSRHGQQLTKGSLSQILRSRIYCGWVKSRNITARGTFEPLISEEVFEKCQDVLNGRVRAKTHRQQHEDWPLRRFVLCGACGKPLTSGWSKNSKGKRYGYYFCEEKGCRAVKGRKEVIESSWIGLLGMMEPTEDLLRRAPELAAKGWELRREHHENELRQLNTRLAAQQAMNMKAIEARVQGIISDEDFSKIKQSIQTDLEHIQEGLRALDKEHATMKELIENTNYKLQNLSFWWQAAGLQDRIELQFSLWPEGLRWTPSNFFLNTSNHSLYQQVEEMMRDLVVHGGRSRT